MGKKNLNGRRVSIHTPTKGVTYKVDEVDAAKIVSIHTPTKGVTMYQKRKSPNRSFNPHTHEGCDVGKNYLIERNRVSIHTPTKGVTQSHQ